MHQRVLAEHADLISTRAGRAIKAQTRPAAQMQVRREPKLREPAAVAAAAKDVIPANRSKDKALAERERAPREPELVAGAEVSIPANIRARALKARKLAQVEVKLAPTFKAEVLNAVRRADKARVAEKAVTRANKLKDRCRVERKAAREA